MANYDAFLFRGHGVDRSTGKYDCGASSQGATEHDLVESICASALKYIGKLGLVIHSDENNYANKSLANNTYSLKFGISVHINAGGGNGTEIFVPCKEKYLMADFNICSSISSDLGIPNRGVKSRDYNSEKTYTRANGIALNYTDYYGEINDAWRRGVSLAILEVGFIDTSDLAKIKANIDKIGYRIAQYYAYNSNKTIASYESLNPSIDYEKEVCRVIVNGVNKISLTGKTKCIDYAKQNYEGAIKIQCVKDSKVISEFNNVLSKPTVCSDCSNVKKELEVANSKIKELNSTIEKLSAENIILKNKIESAKKTLA